MYKYNKKDVGNKSSNIFGKIIKCTILIKFLHKFLTTKFSRYNYFENPQNLYKRNFNIHCYMSKKQKDTLSKIKKIKYSHYYCSMIKKKILKRKQRNFNHLIFKIYSKQLSYTLIKRNLYLPNSSINFYLQHTKDIPPILQYSLNQGLSEELKLKTRLMSSSYDKLKW